MAGGWFLEDRTAKSKYEQLGNYLTCIYALMPSYGNYRIPTYYGPLICVVTPPPPDLGPDSWEANDGVFRSRRRSHRSCLPSPRVPFSFGWLGRVHWWLPGWYLIAKLTTQSGLDKVVRFWDVDSMQPVASSVVEASPQKCLAFEPEGEAILSASSGSLRVWWGGVLSMVL